jgi:hypothetical protein
MENREYIRELLDKYLEGLTSLEEEKVLKEYFNRGNVPKEFQSEARWFQNVTAQQIKEEDINSLEKVLSKWVDQQEHKEKSVRLRSWSIGIAAGLMIVAASVFFLKYYQSGKIADTYEDPQIAYLEAKKVLMYVSQTLNKGTDKLQTVSRIQEGTEEMSIFSSFGSGLKNLELVSKYDESIETQ